MGGGFMFRLNIIGSFDRIMDKNNSKISFSELVFFEKQLNSVGYAFRVKRFNNSVFIEYEKPTLKDLFKRFYALFTRPILELKDYQKFLYLG